MRSVPDILAKILVHTHEDVAAAKALAPLSSLDVARFAPRPFAQALRRAPGEPVRVLAEIKRASPSLGPIDLAARPEDVARSYHDGGATAISVLTEPHFFRGDLAFLGLVREAVDLPLLRKDFIVDAYQVAQARAAGADAILLIVAALSPAQLGELLAAAAHYELDALVEVHSEQEAEVALAANATLIGVNHRDLRTFTIDMSLTGAIAPLLPPDAVLVAESGIKVAADLTLLGAVGAHAVLVGETLMRAPDRAAAVRALRGEP